MAYKKVVAGIANQSNETASNNKIVLGHAGFGWAAAWLTVFVSLWITAAFIWMIVVHGEIVADMVMGAIIGAFITAWIFTLQWVRRDNSNTKTLIVVNDATQQRALNESNVLYATDNYIVYKDHKQEIQFRGSVQLTEHRHYPAIEAPKQEADATETILNMQSNGSSAREIKRWMDYQMRDLPKEQHVSMRTIIKTLNTYRQGWQNDSKKVIEAEDYPVDE